MSLVTVTKSNTSQKCGSCGRAFRSDDGKNKNTETCPDCLRLIRLGLKPVKGKWMKE